MTPTRLHALAAATATVACLLLVACHRKDEPVPTPQSSPPAAPAATPTPAPTAATQEEQPPEGVLRAYVWDCAGTRLKARNLWRENAVAIDLHDGTHKLASVPSASGAKYTDGVVTLSTKGGSATLEAPGQAKQKCSEIRVESLLEDARLRGVRYSGRGNEPGWSLEVGPGQRLAWVTGYGQEKHEFPAVTATGDEASGLVYSAREDAGELQATLRKAACQDDMSGEAFDYQVIVSFGGREYRGCGTQVQP